MNPINCGPLSHRVWSSHSNPMPCLTFDDGTFVVLVVNVSRNSGIDITANTIKHIWTFHSNVADWAGRVLGRDLDKALVHSSFRVCTPSPSYCHMS